MIRRARAFDMPVMLWSRRFDGRDDTLTAEDARALGFRGRARLCVRLAPSLLELAAQCDVLCVHLALSPETQRIVGPAVLARLKPGAILINTARGELVDHAALAEAVRTRGPARRPRRVRARARHRDRRRSTIRSRRCPASTARTTSARRPTRRRKRSPPRPCASSAPSPRPGACRTSSTWRGARRRRTCSSCATTIGPGVLAHVFGHLRERSLNVQETENIVFEGALAAVARINLDKAPDAALLDSLRASPDILDLQVVPL